MIERGNPYYISGLPFLSFSVFRNVWCGLTKSKEYTKIAVYHTGEHESSLDFRERAEERTEYGTNSFE